MNPVKFNAYKTVKNGPIRKQAFGTSKATFKIMYDRFIDSGFQQEGEIHWNGQYHWCQMLFVGRGKNATINTINARGK